MYRKFLIIFAFLLLSATGHAAVPPPSGFVNDYAGAIDAGRTISLENMLSAFERETGNEVAVAVLPSLEGGGIEDVAVALYKQWGIGKKGQDNGVLFLIVPSERKTRIEVGYGLEGAINDALAGRILDTAVLPRFRDGQISDGIAAGTVAIVRTIVQKEGLSFDVGTAMNAGSAGENPEGGKQKDIPLVFKILGLLVLGYLFIRHPWLFLLLLSSTGRGGGGGFGGGFGGFGGGGSGGGGASRGW